MQTERVRLSRVIFINGIVAHRSIRQKSVTSVNKIIIMSIPSNIWMAYVFILRKTRSEQTPGEDIKHCISGMV